MSIATLNLQMMLLGGGYSVSNHSKLDSYELRQVKNIQNR